MVDPEGFREAVMAQRERLMATQTQDSAPKHSADPDKESVALLRDIRDSLHRLEAALPKPPA